MAEKKKPICPNCGSEAYCFRRSKEGPLYFDSIDEYSLWCPNCSYHSTSERHAGWSFLIFCTTAKTNCPFCGEPADVHAKGALFEEVSAALKAAREEIPSLDPDADICPRCGKGEVVCTYLGNTSQDDSHWNYVWKHTCTRCDYERNFAESHNLEDPDDRIWLQSPDRRDAGKAGGCPGHNGHK